MDDAQKVTALGLAYELFNDHSFDQLLALMVDDVLWPDVAAGAVPVGRPAIGQYWAAKFAVTNPRVLPRVLVNVEDQVFVVVEPRISDLGGAPIAEPVMVYHPYTFRDDLISRMDFHATRESAAGPRPN